MPTPIYILAGQSNAGRLSDRFDSALNAALGEGTYHSIAVYDIGASLLYDRPDSDQLDWGVKDELRQELEDAVSAVRAADGDAYVAGIIWVQGEADSWTNSFSTIYAERFESLIEDFRATLRDMPNYLASTEFNIAISGLSDYAGAASTHAHWPIIQAQQEFLAAQNWDISLVSPDSVAASAGIPQNEMFDSDGIHYRDGVMREALVEALVNVATKPSQVISADHFGVNALIQYNQLADTDSLLSQGLLALSPHVLRYPGGTVTEQFSTQLMDHVITGTKNDTAWGGISGGPLYIDEFMTSAATLSSDATLVIVIPTRNAFILNAEEALSNTLLKNPTLDAEIGT